MTDSNHAYNHPSRAERERGIGHDEFGDWFREHYAWWLADDPARPLDVIDMRLAWEHYRWTQTRRADLAAVNEV